MALDTATWKDGAGASANVLGDKSGTDFMSVVKLLLDVDGSFDATKLLTLAALLGVPSTLTGCAIYTIADSAWTALNYSGAGNLSGRTGLIVQNVSSQAMRYTTDNTDTAAECFALRTFARESFLLPASITLYGRCVSGETADVIVAEFSVT